MKSTLQILTTPTADTPGTSLFLHFDDKRYIIGNIHEGTQRAAVEEGTRLVKLSEIFLTGKTEWSTHGGLIGVILTLADTIRAAKDATIAHQISKAQARLQRERDQLQKKHPQKDAVESTIHDEVPPETLEKRTLTIHGGPNVTHTLASARRFTFRKGMPITVNEIRETERQKNWEPTWTDHNIRVWAMSINPSQDPGASLSGNTPSPRKRSFDEFQEKSASDTMTNNKSCVPQTPADTEDQDQRLRRAVVSNMFDSDWRPDKLDEIPIAQASRTATLFVRDPATHKIKKYTGPLPGGPDPLPDINVLVRKPWPGALIAQLPPTKPSATALSYIIRNNPQRGRFLPDKAKALNVEKGYKFGELAMGNPVISTDGKTVLPEQVMEPGKPGTGFAVIELPSKDYVYELISRPEWRASEVMEGVEVFLWILGPGVGEDSSLMNFMNEFKNHKHVVSSQHDCPNMLSMDSAATGAIRLHQIDPKRHPVPVHNNVSTATRDIVNVPSRMIPDRLIARRGLTIHLEPSFSVQEAYVKPPLNTALVIDQTPKDVLLLARSIQEEVASDSFRRMIESQDLPSPDAEIICLGTGSALPSKYRNVSATLLRVPGSGSYLLDCGENTLGQLNRIYGPEELVEVLQDLKMIWISHLHADHHLGTVSVIKAWYRAVYGKDYKPQIEPKVALAEHNLDPAEILKEQKRLFVASDVAMLNWLHEYASVEDYGYNMIVALKVTASIPGKPYSTRLEWNNRTLSFSKARSPQDHSNDALRTALRAATGLTYLAAANVSHCHGAKAVSLTFPGGFKFSYSGDCRPSRSFTEIGKDSTVLLHEATFDDELRGDAIAKLHSTTSEAIGVGIAMAARRVLLTHFSQRYQKVPIMDDVEGQDLILEDETDDLSPPAETDGDAATTNAKDPVSETEEDDSILDETMDPRAPSSSTSKPSKSKSRKVTSLTRKPGQDMKVGVAFDYMRVKVKDMAILERFTPVYLKLYENEYDKLTNNASRSGSEEPDVDVEQNKETKGKKKEKKKMGNGKMGRVQMSEQQKMDMRSGKKLFNERDRQRA